MRMEHGELVAVVLEEPHVGIDLQLVAIRRRERVAAAHVALGNAVAQHEHAAAFVRGLLLGVRAQCRADRGGDPPHSLLPSISPPCQNGALRYFHPPSASTHATTDSSGSSSATRHATCTAAPADTPAKMP